MSKKPKVVVVSPSSPFRGGIAQYTDALVDALSKKSEVQVVSFKRLYPKFLYPGKSDKDTTGKVSKNIKKSFILDFYSFFSLRRAVNHINEQKPDAVIIAWWTFVWQPMLGYIARSLRKKGIKVVFLCHNVVDHEGSSLKKRISYSNLKHADGYIVHSQEEELKVRELLPDAKILRRAHPIYNHFPKSSVKPKESGRLELLYFGLIREYKGVDTLLDALEYLNDPNVHTTIVGEIWDKNNQRSLMQRVIKQGDKVSYKFAYVSDQEAANYFERADVVVLPYKSATGSGVVTLAYNYGKPVIASSVDGLTDVVINGKTGWLFKPGNPKDLADTIKNTSRNKVKSLKPNIDSYCKENSWENMAGTIISFFNVG